MLLTLQNVRDNIRNRDGRRVCYVRAEDRLTWEAKDWLAQEGVEILPAEEAKKDRWRLLSGGFVEEKPEHMTHLDGQTLVPKTHPRIRFRGALDSLEAELLTAALEAEGWLRRDLEEILELVRKVMAWDVLEQPAEALNLLGLTEQELRRRSHFPREHYGIDHFMPQVTDGPRILAVNRARCAARAAELAAAAAFSDREGLPTRPDILKTMNRVSSALYLLMIRLKGQREE